MPQTNRSRNRALVDSVVLPLLFLTVALLGGLRVGVESRAFIFIVPPLVKLSTRYYLSAVCSTGCFRSFFVGRSGTISFRRSTRAGSCAALRYCSGQLSFSSICCWRVCTVPKVVGSSV